jgi:hypothetical protein
MSHLDLMWMGLWQSISFSLFLFTANDISIGCIFFSIHSIYAKFLSSLSGLSTVDIGNHTLTAALCHENVCTSILMTFFQIHRLQEATALCHENSCASVFMTFSQMHRLVGATGTRTMEENKKFT